MTYVTDPIGDLIARMRNAQHVRHASCRAPYSRVKHELLQVMKAEGWIADVEKVGEDPKFELEVTFAADKPKLEMSRVSKPGRRVYTQAYPPWIWFCICIYKPWHYDRQASPRKKRWRRSSLYYCVICFNFTQNNVSCRKKTSGYSKRCHHYGRRH